MFFSASISLKLRELANTSTSTMAMRRERKVTAVSEDIPCVASMFSNSVCERGKTPHVLTSYLVKNWHLNTTHWMLSEVRKDEEIQSYLIILQRTEETFRKYAVGPCNEQDQNSHGWPLHNKHGGQPWVSCWFSEKHTYNDDVWQHEVFYYTQSTAWWHTYNGDSGVVAKTVWVFSINSSSVDTLGLTLNILWAPWFIKLWCDYIENLQAALQGSKPSGVVFCVSASVSRTCRAVESRQRKHLVAHQSKWAQTFGGITDTQGEDRRAWVGALSSSGDDESLKLFTHLSPCASSPRNRGHLLSLWPPLGSGSSCLL